ncbi:MAG: hypothetical protein V4510_01070 [bacterium]
MRFLAAPAVCLILATFAGCSAPAAPPETAPPAAASVPSDVSTTQAVDEAGNLPGPGRCVASSCFFNGDGRLLEIGLNESQALVGTDLTIRYFSGVGSTFKVHAELLCLSEKTCPTKVIAMADGPLPLRLMSNTTTLPGASLELDAWQPELDAASGTSELVSVTGVLDLVGTRS